MNNKRHYSCVKNKHSGFFILQNEEKNITLYNCLQTKK